MEAVPEKLTEQLNSGVFVLPALLVLAGYALFKGGTWIGEWRQKYGNHEDRLDRVEEKIEKIHDLLHKVSAKMDIIYDEFNSKKLAQSHSPLTLTKLGKKVAKAINAPAVFAKHRSTLLEKLAQTCGEDPTPYDVQENAFRIIKEQFVGLLTRDEIRRFKEIAYQEGFPYEDIWIIFAIFLRDEGLRVRDLPVPAEKEDQ